MACCYIAASMIAFIINTCEALDVDINLQYNETLDPSKSSASSEDGSHASKQKSSGPTILSLSGLTCAACITNVEKVLLAVEGVERVVVSLPFQEAEVVHDAKVSNATMISAVEDAGYEADVGQRAPEQRVEAVQHNKELKLLSTAISEASQLSAGLFFVGPGCDLMGWTIRLDRMITPLGRQAILMSLTLMIVFHSGHFIHQSTWSQMKKISVNMNSLISLSTTLGILLSIFNIVIQGPAKAYTYNQTVSGLILTVTAGRYLDLLSRRQATNTFVGLYAMLHETAAVKVKGYEVNMMILAYIQILSPDKHNSNESLLRC